jgi:hypothetical protein
MLKVEVVIIDTPSVMSVLKLTDPSRGMSVLKLSSAMKGTKCAQNFNKPEGLYTIA